MPDRSLEQPREETFAMAGTSKTKLAQILRSSILCRDLPQEALKTLAVRGRIVRYAAGEFVVRQNQTGDSLMIVTSGRIKIVTYPRKGVEVMHNLIEKGMVLGELSILDGRPRSANAVAMVATETLTLSRTLVMEYLNRHPKMALRLLTVLCGKLRKATALHEETLFQSLPARLVRLLERLAREHGKTDGKAIVIRHGMSQDDLGGLLGVTRESVNRQFGVWKAAGLVEVSRGCVIVRRPEALSMEADPFLC